jgi:AcrR family transcriptional regulator
MTTRKRVLLSWRDETKTLLREAGVSMAAVAKALGVNRATLHRYLDGKHEPQPETIANVTGVVAQLVAPRFRLLRIPEDGESSTMRGTVADYLAAVAAYEFGDRDDASARGIERGLAFIESYLRPSVVKQIHKALRKNMLHGQSKKVPRSEWPITKLGLELLVEVRRILLDIARSRSVTMSRFDRIAAIFERQDASLKGKMKPRNEVRPTLAYEWFYARIAASIAQRIEDRSERLALLGSVECAVGDLVKDLNELSKRT